MRKFAIAFALFVAAVFAQGQSIQAPPGGITTPIVVGKPTNTSDVACTVGTYWIAPIAGSTNAWRKCDNGVLSNIAGTSGGGLQGCVIATSNLVSLQTYMNTACTASPVQCLYIPADRTALDIAQNTCNAVVMDVRSPMNFASGEINVKNFGADGTGNGYVDMTTNSASHNVGGCKNMTSAQIVGKYLHVLRAGPGGTIFKSLITSLSGETCTVADFPSVTTIAGGWVSSNDDDAPGFQAAFDMAKATGQEVVIPPGNYFLLAPAKLPKQQTTIVPWANNSIRIRGLGGNYSAHLFYVQNATVGPMRAIIEGPTVRTATTAWSQTTNNLTITMASNPYQVGDLLDFWTPTGGALNSGSASNPVGPGITGGYYVQSRTATTVTVNTDNSATAGATEVGELSQMGTPIVPFISGIDFETLDFPYASKVVGFVANGIDTHAYTSFVFKDNYLGNLQEGIRIYRSWLGTIGPNECYGAHICIHAPKNLGALNAIHFDHNNLDAYDTYGILTEANQDGGSYENDYDGNEIEGTGVNTRADMRINGGGLTFKAGYSETAGSQEALYRNLIIDGYGNFTFHFPWSIQSSGSTTYSFGSTGGSAQIGPNMPGPTLTRIAGSGTFPAGRDVYIHNSMKNSATGWESNPGISNYVLTNTVLNDRVQVSQSLYQDYSHTIDQFCVYEADVATGQPAPAQSSFRKANCSAIGTPFNVDATAVGTQQRSVGWSIDERGFADIFTGIVPSMVSTSPWDATTDLYFPGNNSFFGQQLGVGSLAIFPRLIGSSVDWSTSNGRADIGGVTLGASQGNLSTSNSYPIEFGATAKIPFSAFIRSTNMFNSPYDNNWGWLCVANPCTANPVTSSQWRRFGDTFQRMKNDGTTPPASGAYTQGDYMWNIAPAAINAGIPTIRGWHNISSGSPGTWQPDYSIDPAKPPDFGLTTPATGTFTKVTVRSTAVTPDVLCSGQCTLAWWFKADALALSDGASVTSLTDSSSGAHNATCSATQPIFKTNIFSGKPVVRFVQGTTSSCVTGTFSVTGSYTIFYVASKTTGFTALGGLLGGNSGNTYFWPYSAATNYRIQNNSGSAGYVQLLPTLADDGKQHLFANVMQVGNSFVAVDGATAATVANTNLLDFLTSHVMNVSNTVASGFSWGGDLAELIVYQGALNDSDRIKIQQYLGAKWGIPATSRLVDVQNSSGTSLGNFDANGKLTANGSIEGFSTLSFSATPQFDFTSTNTIKMTLTANVTSSTLVGATAGQPLTIILCQDSTGSRTMAWPANVIGAMTIGSTLSKCNAQTFVYDGTNAVATSLGVTNE